MDQVYSYSLRNFIRYRPIARPASLDFHEFMPFNMLIGAYLQKIDAFGDLTYINPFLIGTYLVYLEDQLPRCIIEVNFLQ